ncbi:hypothetical protein NIES22_42830 [Calothrix brevissima NIES-22]|nr:hypothetical protein NIES22_42830 [Calothrix brevissima NIES-22]
MSNALSIAAVTAVLKDVLENGLVSDSITASVGDVTVTALPPDLITVGTDERAQLNLFLYQVTQNRNVDWVSPEFRSKSSRIGKNSRTTNPPLALDLHYLLTAYGAKDFQAELLLGYAMQLLHKTPAIATSAIENALKNAATRSSANVFSQALASVSVSDLAEQIGQIKLSPEFFNMEDTSKLWSALQTHYRPSASYQASMVLIESNDAYQAEGLSVLSSLPIIEQVIAPAEPEQLIFTNSTLVIRGKKLRGEITKIRLDNSEKLLVPEDVKETQISLLVPSDLSVGVHGVQVVHLTMGNQKQKQEIESNVTAFVLHPQITVAIAEIAKTGENFRKAKITVKFQPKVGKTQRLVLLLHEMSNQNPSFYFVPVTLLNEDTDAITIPVTDIKPGTYLVRVRVDGAESPLHTNQAGEYDAPQVIIS